MGFFGKWIEKRKEDKEEFKKMEKDLRFKKILEEKQKSPAQREHEFYEKEKQREELKRVVEMERKERAEKMKNLSDPFNKPSIMDRNDLIGVKGMNLR